MPYCSICFESLKAPVCLPCGHIFCRECIARTVDAVDASSIQHFCPACRAPYNVVSADPSLVPSHLRQHLLPQIRPVFFDSLPAASTSEAPARTHSDPDLGRALTENTALRLGCTTWRRRAEVHAAANQGLLALARTGKTHALRMQAERDEAVRRCTLLKRKLCELMCVFPPTPVICLILTRMRSPDLESKLRDAAHAHESLHILPTQKQPYAHAPVARAPSRPLAPTVPKRSCSPVSILGPPFKRRRRSASVEVQNGGARDA
jgi:hypothetical protein